MNEPASELAKEAIDSAKQLVPQLYEDAAQASVKEVGVTLHNLVRTVLRPVNDLIWTAEHAYTWVVESVSEQIKKRGIPHERLVTPPAQIVGEVIQGLQIAGPATEPDLREMYAALLTTAMDGAYPGAAHPAFAEILRQLTPDEAKILKLMQKQNGFAVAQIRIDEIRELEGDAGVQREERSRTVVARQANCADPKAEYVYLDNLERLRIIIEHVDVIERASLFAGWKAVTSGEHLRRGTREYEAQEHEAYVARQLLDYPDSVVQGFVNEMRDVPGSSEFQPAGCTNRYLFVRSVALTSFGERLLKACSD